MLRLFVALPLPGSVGAHLADALASVALTDDRPGARPVLREVPPEQRHVTLAFYGDVPGGAAPALEADLRAALGRLEPLRLQLAGAGTFARRTLWVGVREARPDPAPEPGGDDGGRPDGGRPDRGLERLMATCEEVGGRHADVARRDRRRAHVTVARVRPGSGGESLAARRAHALALYTGPSWTAAHAVLVSSHLGAGRGGGPLHEVLAEVPLGGAET